MRKKVECNTVLKKWRTNLCLTQEEIAYEIGVSRGSYASYETLRRIPSTIPLFSMAKCFGVSPEEILETFNVSIY